MMLENIEMPELFWIRLVCWICAAFNLCMLVLAAKRNPKIIDLTFFIIVVCGVVVAPAITFLTFIAIYRNWRASSRVIKENNKVEA